VRTRGLLERDDELGRIAAAIADAGRVIVVEGEAGIGKSALLSAGIELGRAAGARVFTARAGLLERDFGHGVTRQLFERPLVVATGSQRRRWLAGAAGLASPVLGLEATSAAGEMADPAVVAQHGLYWLTANIAGDGPLVLVVDDLHWADLASFRWLVYLARRLEDLPVVLLAAWRVGEPHAPQNLLDALGGERLTPQPLSIPAATVLVGRELERGCDLGIAAACHRVTYGNPLLLSQLTHALKADAELPLNAELITDRGARAVAPYVRGRLDGLPPPAADVAAAAAVLEGEVAPRQLAAMTTLELAEVRKACDHLVEARLLSGRERLQFVHPLVRSAIYETLSPAGCAAAHRAAADVLDADGLADRAAVHLVLAELAGDPAVVARLTAAARRATQRGAVEEAVVLLSRALDEPPPLAARHEVLMTLAQAEWLARDEAAIEHARAALDAADSPAQFEAAAILLARLLGPAGHQQEAVDLLARTADKLRQAAPERALRLEVQRLSWSLMLPRPPRGIGRSARLLAAQVPPGSLQAQILNATAAPIAAMTGVLPASAAADMVLSALEDRRMLEDLSITAPFHWLLATLGHCERLDDYSEWVKRRAQHAARSGSRIEPPLMAMHRARIAWLHGNLAAAIEEARQALKDTEAYGFFVPFTVASLVSALVEQGQLDEAEHVLARHGMANGTTFTWWMLVAPRIKLAVARGDLCRAREQLAAAPYERTSLPLQLAPYEVAVLLATGSTDEAREHARAMLAAAERFGAPGALGIAQRLLGLTTGGTEGLELLRRAVDSLQLSPRRLELARALVDYGAALRRQKHRVAAREPLRHGLDLAQRCGATTLLQQAADELRATGARPRRLLLTGVESLTPSELRVARLVAQGRSNPEVAQALFITRSTVETHLQAAFRKLDLNSRDRLADALAAKPAET
jgi:DNA-binding CsgD family transcriptional regulator